MDGRIILALVAALALTAHGCGRSCAEIDQTAHQAIEDNRACEADTDCQAILVAFSCIPGIVCWTPVAADADTDAISETILAASNDRRSSGCGCTQPECDATPPPVRCAAGSCEFGP